MCVAGSRPQDFGEGKTELLLADTNLGAAKTTKHTRIVRSRSKALDKGDSRNHGFWDPDGRMCSAGPLQLLDQYPCELSLQAGGRATKNARFRASP